MVDPVEVRNNEAERRYEIVADGMIAVCEYEMGEGKIIFTHTEVPVTLGGRGIASALARAALTDARVRGLKVVLRCPFLREYVERHPEYADLVVPH